MKRTKGEKIYEVFNILFMIFIIAITLYPIYYVIMASFSDSTELMAQRGLLLKPVGFSTYAYKNVLKNSGVYTGFKNTFIILAVGMVINMYLTLCGGYFLSRKNVKWNRLITFLIMITMYFSGGIVPSYLVIKTLGMEDTLWSVILPGALSTYNMIIMRTGFKNIPDALEEAARIDGAGHMTILFKICVPLLKPTIAVLALYAAVGYWNSWFNASIYIHDRELFPLQLVLREILILSDTNQMQAGGGAADAAALAESLKYAVIVVSSAPILCLYPFLQKFFEKGIMVGSVKG